MLKRICCLGMCLILFFSMLVSCENSKDFVGKWYDKNGRCLDIRKDNTYKLDGEYGTGTWKILDGGEIEFIDFYGDSNTSELKKHKEYGLYISYNNRLFCKDGYPENISNNSVSNKNNSDDKDYVEEIEDEFDGAKSEKIKIDPFYNIQFTVSGVSPYCTVAINNSKCSEEAQQYVTYTLDKSQYSNGDKILVKASLNSYGKNKYTLSSDTYNGFIVDNQPEFITSLQNVNLTSLKSELNDYISAGKAKVVANNSDLFSLNYIDVDSPGYTVKFLSVKNVILKENYLSCLKSAKKSEFKIGRICYNRISFVYQVEYFWEGKYDASINGVGTAWFTISAENIVRYPDGRIEWGSTSIGKGDFTCEDSIQGLNACVSSTIMVNSDKYNITKTN